MTRETVALETPAHVATSAALTRPPDSALNSISEIDFKDVSVWHSARRLSIPCLDLTCVADTEDAPAVVVADQDATVWDNDQADGPRPRASALDKTAQQLLLPHRLTSLEVDADYVVAAASVAGLVDRAAVEGDQRIAAILGWKRRAVVEHDAQWRPVRWKQHPRRLGRGAP